MDKPIDLSELRPTRPPEKQGSEQQPPLLTPDAVLQLQDQTNTLLRHPYDPSNWSDRAKTLALIGFPELAAGDAMKAVRLCQNMDQLQQSFSGKTWRLGSGRGFWMLDDEQPTAEEPEYLPGLQALLDNLEREARDILEDNTLYYHSYEGRYVPQAYPWLENRHRGRNSVVMEDINKDIWKNEARTPLGKPYIEVKRCSFKSGEDLESETAALGIFTRYDIKKNTTILIDFTDLFGCNGPGDDNSTANLHGGQGCHQKFHPNLAEDAAGSSLRWVRNRAGKHAPDVLLLCRTLITCVRLNVQSPFDLPAIARLVPSYHRESARKFSLDDDIAIIHDALQQFGIDIFADQRYDTWVIFTLSALLRNNSWTTPLAAALSPLFSLFNHSCEPNAQWQTMRDHRTIHVRVSEDVAAGEQLFVEYDSYAHDYPLETRRKHLSHWIERCMCSRCAREERDLEEARAHEERDGDGEDSFVS
ncbi:hypothetical protein Q7P37_004140 [Cladosporium fusiforme]